jgi:hypothetical protein
VAAYAAFLRALLVVAVAGSERARFVAAAVVFVAVAFVAEAQPVVDRARTSRGRRRQRRGLRVRVGLRVVLAAEARRVGCWKRSEARGVGAVEGGWQEEAHHGFPHFGRAVVRYAFEVRGVN